MMRVAAPEPFGTLWHEAPTLMDSLSSLRRHAEASKAPVCASETLGSRWAFRNLLETGVARVVMLDPSRCGGLSEACKVASMAKARHLPVAPHDRIGPVVRTLDPPLDAPNALVQEPVRAFHKGRHRDVVAALPEAQKGMVSARSGPGARPASGSRPRLHRIPPDIRLRQHLSLGLGGGGWAWSVRRPRAGARRRPPAPVPRRRARQA